MLWAYNGRKVASDNKPIIFNWALWAYGDRKEASENKPITFI